MLPIHFEYIQAQLSSPFASRYESLIARGSRARLVTFGVCVRVVMAPSEQQPNSQHEQQQARQRYMNDNKGFKNNANGRESRQGLSDDISPDSSATYNSQNFGRPTFAHHPEDHLPAFYGSTSSGMLSGSPGEMKGLTAEDLSARILSGQTAIASMQAVCICPQTIIGRKQNCQLQILYVCFAVVHSVMAVIAFKTFDCRPRLPSSWGSDAAAECHLCLCILRTQCVSVMRKQEVVLLERTLGQRSQVQQLQATVDKHSATIAELESDLRDRDRQNEVCIKPSCVCFRSLC